MPVVLVAAPPHPETPALLVAVADAIAGALELAAGDVIATHVPTAAQAASGGAAIDPWPVVTIHGGDRGAALTEAARAAAEGAVLGWAEIVGVALGGAWISWVPSAP